MLSIKQFFNKWFNVPYTNHKLPRIETKNLHGDILFSDFFIKYLKSLDGSNRSRTYASMLTTSSHIIEGLGDYKMSQINKTVLKEFINGFTKKTYVKGNSKPQYYSQSQIDKVYNLLRGAIKEASDPDGDRILRTDFMANIKKPRSNRCKSPEIQVLTDEEINMLSNIVSEAQMISVWVHLMLYTGVRPSEALALKFSDINYGQKTVDIMRTLSQEEFFDVTTLSRVKPRQPIITTLKNEREGQRINFQRRTLKVGDKILDILRIWEFTIKDNSSLMELKRKNGTEEYLFCGPRGQLWLYDDYKQVYERLLKKHGISPSEYNPYRFRHNCCTRLFRLNVNIKAVQLIMGDNTSDMVMRVYANLDKSDVLKGSKAFSDSLDLALGIISEDVKQDHEKRKDSDKMFESLEKK